MIPRDSLNVEFIGETHQTKTFPRRQSSIDASFRVNRDVIINASTVMVPHRLEERSGNRPVHFRFHMPRLCAAFRDISRHGRRQNGSRVGLARLGRQMDFAVFPNGEIALRAMILQEILHGPRKNMPLDFRNVKTHSFFCSDNKDASPSLGNIEFSGVKQRVRNVIIEFFSENTKNRLESFAFVVRSQTFDIFVNEDLWLN